MIKLFSEFFLKEKSSLTLAGFRIAVALTTAFHVIPTFMHLNENYFATAFKSINTSFFPVEFIMLVSKSPQWLIVLFVYVFCISCVALLLGLKSQLSCILMTISCYYFYALNAFHVGTLSWDILLVTLFLMCIVPYHGDYFSIDCLSKGKEAYRTKRPYFLVRLLQLQIGFTFFYTALYKVTSQGNWFKDNPIFSIMQYPPAGTTKWFLLRDYLQEHPQFCFAIGVTIVILEFLMIFLLFNKKTRMSAIYLGMIFHVILVLTLDVPAIFFFLFPAQLLLFLDSDEILLWVDRIRVKKRGEQKDEVCFDGHCQFCQGSVSMLKAMDLFNHYNYVDLHSVDPKQVGQGLDKKDLMSQLHLKTTDGRVFGGFFVFQKICFHLPMMMPLILFFYFPGVSIVGPWGYSFIAKNRYLFNFNKKCDSNACSR